MESMVHQNSDQDGWNGVYEGGQGLSLDGQPVTYRELCQKGLGHMVAGPVVPRPRGATETIGKTREKPPTVPDTSIFFS